MRTQGFAAAAALLAGLGVAACGGQSGGGGQPPPPQQSASTKAASGAGGGAPVATIDVRETEFKIEPSKVRIEKPGRVRFRVKNVGHAPHALEIQGPQGDVKTNVLQGGNSATLTANLTKPGRYTWYCPVGDHRQEGMVGKITVASAGGASARDKQSSQGGGSSSGY